MKESSTLRFLANRLLLRGPQPAQAQCEKSRAAAWQNQQSDMYAQRRHRSAWASAKSEVFTVRVKKPWVLSYLSVKRKIGLGIQTGQMPRLIESSLGAQVTLLFLSCGGSLTDHQYDINISDMVLTNKQYSLLQFCRKLLFSLKTIKLVIHDDRILSKSDTWAWTIISSLF